MKIYEREEEPSRLNMRCADSRLTFSGSLSCVISDDYQFNTAKDKIKPGMQLCLSFKPLPSLELIQDLGS